MSSGKFNLAGSWEQPVEMSLRTLSYLLRGEIWVDLEKLFRHLASGFGIAK